ncbi:hypothetical protein AZE42_06371 [Rhizopogon vesiculosus]|uniref:Uncharacterized protein n=1 Tax=Rhizopogon vesiculosus TaxID=180088 RepID=A0A1J8Q0G0_9AGAM|nr:hypothetical protein AZE42_06371 [Rhizopogon vesiculosus]
MLEIPNPIANVWLEPHEHIASPDGGLTTQQPIGTDDKATLESNVSSANPPAIVYLIMVLLHRFIEQHRTLEYPLPTTT